MKTFFFDKLAAFMLALFVYSPAMGQTVVPLDDPNSATVEALELGDPFFELVVKASPQPTRLLDLEQRLQPNAALRNRFAVAENMQSEALGPRRAVISFEGDTLSSTGETISIGGNVMLSTTFLPGALPAGEEGTEVWGWDAQRGRYNYYKLVGPSWTFQGTSSGPEVDNKTGCMQCHHNGTPIMKELLVPWPNWHSPSDKIGYLSSPVWNPPTARIFSDGEPNGAQELQNQILATLIRFHTKEIEAATVPLGNGTSRIEGAQDLLRPIFETTEINFGSSRTPTGGLHPFSTSAAGPISPIRIPNTHFLNARLLAKNGFPGASAAGSLNIDAAQEFASAAEIPPDLYEALVRSNDLKLANCEGAIPSLSGDARFAWLHPEPGLFDVRRVEQLLVARAIESEFLAAAMAVDLRTPIFSEDRAALLRFVPDSYTVGPTGPIDLNQQVLSKLAEASDELTASQLLFRDRLNSGNALGQLEEDVAKYLQEVETAFSAAPSTETFQDELVRQFEHLLLRRASILSRANFCNLIEGPLLPVKGE